MSFFAIGVESSVEDVAEKVSQALAAGLKVCVVKTMRRGPLVLIRLKQPQVWTIPLHIR